MLQQITAVRAGSVRRTETPNAVMTTLASPTVGGTEGLSVWRVEMGEGASGPTHRVNVEQVWTVTAGRARITSGAEVLEIAAGDTVVLPPDVDRTIVAAGPFAALVASRSDAVVRVPGEVDDRGTPSWMR